MVPHFPRSARIQGPIRELAWSITQPQGTETEVAATVAVGSGSNEGYRGSRTDRRGRGIESIIRYVNIYSQSSENLVSVVSPVAPSLTKN